MRKESFGDQVIAYNLQLSYHGHLPKDFAVLNPFQQNPETVRVMELFYQKFYGDQHQRKFIIGINPSRHGAGITGVPFTDTKRLKEICGIEMFSAFSHEPSSVFMYELIEAYGGPELFYHDFYINSPFPMALIRKNKQNKWVNMNYYDDKALFEMVKPFMVATLKQHFALRLENTKVYVLGKKNAKYIEQINKEEKLFDELVALEHPRYIQQYQFNNKQQFLEKYLGILSGNSAS